MDNGFLRVTGTGAVMNLTQIGFVPDWVRVVNITDANVTDEWFRQASAPGTSIRTDTAVGPRAAPGGITAIDGGVSLGAAIAVLGKVLIVQYARNQYSTVD
jgi:hypothetical protein